MVTRALRIGYLFTESNFYRVCGSIHPASTIGFCIMLDHTTGIIIDETTVIENDVSILQSVTLGGTSKNCSDRPHYYS